MPLPPTLISVVTAYLATVAVAVTVGLGSYALLQRRLRERHADVVRDLDLPPLFNGSARRSLALQQFIYTVGFRHETDPVLRRISRFVAVFTPLLLLAVLVEVVWWTVLVVRLIT